MTYKLDIFELLGDINNPNSGDIYAKLTDEEKKGFSPLVVMRWLSGTSDKAQILALNQFANTSVIPLAKHPHLLMLTLQACCSKKGGRNNWLAIKGGSKKTSLRNQVMMDFYEWSSNEMRDCFVFPSDDEIVEMAESLGWQKDEVTKLKKELKE